MFLSLPDATGECIDRHRVFVDRAECQTYMGEHTEFSTFQTKAYTLDEIAQVLAAGLPEDPPYAVDAPAGAPHVLVVGMVTHLPFKTDVLPVIEEATDPFQSRIRLQFVDASPAPGKAILSAHGIHEHLPVVLFLDDED